MKETHKLLSIAFDSSREAEVQAALAKAEIDNFIKYDHYTGKIRTCRLLDTHVWPGRFTRYLVEVDNEEFKRLKPLLEDLSEQYCEDGFRVLVIAVEEAI